jgi:hypothetical protein
VLAPDTPPVAVEQLSDDTELDSLEELSTLAELSSESAELLSSLDADAALALGGTSSASDELSSSELCEDDSPLADAVGQLAALSLDDSTEEASDDADSSAELDAELTDVAETLELEDSSSELVLVDTICTVFGDVWAPAWSVPMPMNAMPAEAAATPARRAVPTSRSPLRTPSSAR